MALPQLRLPFGTPPFLRDTHEIETISLYANTQMQTGAAIRRRMWVSAPRYATAVLEMDTPRMEAFDEFFENALKAGVEKFSAEIQNQGPGLLWWSCRFLEPYSVEYLGGLWWRVNAKLMLFDEGSVEPPVPTTLIGSVRIGLSATAGLVVEQPISGSVVIALEQNTVITALSGSVTMALQIASYLPPAAVGAAAGTSTVAAVPLGFNVGAAAGTSTASGVSFTGYAGAAAGTSTASGVSQSIATSVGSAAGTSTASTAISGDVLLLETGTDRLLLEDGVSYLLLE